MTSTGFFGRAPVFALLILLIAGLGAALRLYDLAEQTPLFDDVLATFTAERYVDSGQQGPTMPYHPNLRNLLVYAGHQLWGAGPIGLRSMSLLTGILSIPLLAFLLLRLLGDPLAALLGASFLALDPVHITFSRQVIQEVHTPFFFLAGVLVFIEAERLRWRPRWLWLLPLSGLFFGLSIASKSHGLFPLLVCLSVTLCRRRNEGLRPTAYSVASLVGVPFAVYLLTYLPWFQRGYGLGDWLFQQRALWTTMVTHQGNPMDTLVDTRPLLWFVKPLMGYGDFAEVAGEVSVTVAMGNPLVWLLVLPAAITLLVKKDRSSRTLSLLFWASYLPLALTTRPVWVLSSLAVTPFAFGLVGRFLSRTLSGRAATWLGAYLAAVALVTLLLYPACIGRGWQATHLRPFVGRLSPH